jgi:hypothetical protein
MARPLRINFSAEKFMKRSGAAQNKKRLKSKLVHGT